MIILAIFVGTAVGAVIRYLFTQKINLFNLSYKIEATFLINIVGSLILGMLFHTFSSSSIIYLLLGTGFCGGLTTFSTFNSEISGLLFDKNIKIAFLYFVLSYTGGILSGFAGYYLL